MKYRSFPDIVGLRFGKIVVLEKLDSTKVLIRCDCGTEKSARKYDVFSGKIQSCGKKCTARTKDLVGHRFMLLAVIRQATSSEIKNITGNCIQWFCQCDCGNTLIVPSNQLTSGRTKSCGCGKSAWISEKHAIPIKERVENQLFCSYKKGAKDRGYSFELTKEEFISFLYNDCFYCGSSLLNCMKKQKVTGEEEHYFNGIDRVNNDLGYKLSNCVTCCKICNKAKSDHGMQDFLNWLANINKNFNTINDKLQNAINTSQY